MPPGLNFQNLVFGRHQTNGFAHPKTSRSEVSPVRRPGHRPAVETEAQRTGGEDGQGSERPVGLGLLDQTKVFIAFGVQKFEPTDAEAPAVAARGTQRDFHVVRRGFRGRRKQLIFKHLCTLFSERTYYEPVPKVGLGGADGSLPAWFFGTGRFRASALWLQK